MKRKIKVFFKSYFHVFNGFREGSGVKVINKAEAEILVDTVVECCSNRAYENKTMGIITLQGGAQANLIESMLLEKLGAKEIEKRRKNILSSLLLFFPSFFLLFIITNLSPTLF